ncbi:MAG: hypothetical protein UU80_C0036G0004, partial [candidate division WWE3 bacterium GW2011_GWA1_41_8]
IQKATNRGTSVTIGAKLQAFLNNGLIGHWKMDETADNSCSNGVSDSCDSSGIGLDVPWSGDTNTTIGKFGSAVSLDGTDDRITISPSSDSWYNTDWLNRRKVTFNNSASAVDLTNFPVLVKLNSDRIDYSKTQGYGQDIRFTDSDGNTPLSYEIEKWDETGESIVWVKVPNIKRC